MDERRGEVEPPLHPARVRPDAPVGGVLQVDDGEQLGHAVGGLASRHALEAALQREQFAAGLEVVESGLLERDADAPPHLGGPLPDVDAVDPSAAGGGAQQRGEHADGGGLAGAVRAEEAEDLPALDGEVDAVDGADGGKVPHEPLGPDRRLRRSRHPSSLPRTSRRGRTDPSYGSAR